MVPLEKRAQTLILHPSMPRVPYNIHSPQLGIANGCAIQNLATGEQSRAGCLPSKQASENSGGNDSFSWVQDPRKSSCRDNNHSEKSVKLTRELLPLLDMDQLWISSISLSLWSIMVYCTQCFTKL
jgi:hypothetical protein